MVSIYSRLRHRNIVSITLLSRVEEILILVTLSYSKALVSINSFVFRQGNKIQSMFPGAVSTSKTSDVNLSDTKNPFLKNGIDAIGQSVLTKMNGTTNGVHESSSCQNEADKLHNTCAKNGQANGKESNGCLKSNTVSKPEGNGALDEVNHKKDLVNGAQ